MTKSEFDAKKETLACRFSNCEQVGLLFWQDEQSLVHPGGSIWCKACERMNAWVALEKNKHKRRNMSTEQREAVWQEYGNRCAHCNIHADDLGKLKTFKTVQHVPAFKDAGDDARLIPYCGHCQEAATMAMRQREQIVGIVSDTIKRMEQKNGAA